MVGGNLGAFLGASGGGHSVAPVPLGLGVVGRPARLGLADLELLAGLHDLVGVVHAVGAVPVSIRDALE